MKESEVRLLIDTLIALMLAGVLAGVLLHHREQQRQLQHYHSVHMGLQRLRETAVLRGAMGEAPLSPAGVPWEISPVWFNEGPPLNVVVPGRHPWLDIAPQDDMLDHPPDPVVVRSDQAGFWYNPNLGVFRARVPAQFTEQATVALYNRLNGTAMASLPRQVDAARRARSAVRPPTPPQHREIPPPHSSDQPQRKPVRSQQGLNRDT